MRKMTPRNCSIQHQRLWRSSRYRRFSMISASIWSTIIIIAISCSNIVGWVLGRWTVSNDVPLFVTFEAHLLLTAVLHDAPMSRNTKASRDVRSGLYQNVVLTGVNLLVQYRFNFFDATAIRGKCPSDGFIRNSV